MSPVPRLQGSGFDAKRLRHLHAMGLTTKQLRLRMGVTKHVLYYWMGRLKLKPNREPS